MLSLSWYTCVLINVLSFQTMIIGENYIRQTNLIKGIPPAPEKFDVCLCRPFTGLTLPQGGACVCAVTIVILMKHMHMHHLAAKLVR